MEGEKRQRHVCTRGNLDWVLGKILHWKCCQALEHAAQGSGGVTILARI